MAETRKIGVIVSDLKKMKVALVGEDGGSDLSEEEMKSMDKFQKKKYELNVCLKKLRDDIAKLTDLRKQLSDDTRDKNVIALMSENSKQIATAGDLWKELKVILQEDTRNAKVVKKLGEKELSTRSKAIQLLGQEICDLTAQNSRVKDSGPKNVDELSAATDRGDGKKDAGRKERTDRLAKRKERRGGKTGKGGALELDDSDFRDVKPASEQEQKFMDQVQANVREQDEMLDEISKGLDELKELAGDMNKSLTLQNQMISEVGDEMDKTIEKFKTANGKLKDILDEQGGMTRWCPMIVCLCLLLALLGYLFNMF